MVFDPQRIFECDDQWNGSFKLRFARTRAGCPFARTQARCGDVSVRTL